MVQGQGAGTALMQYAYRDGQYVDVYAMARFRPERNEP